MKTLPSILLIIVLLHGGVPAAAAAAAPAGQIDYPALDAAIAAQMSKHGLPGVALAVVEGDEVVYLKGYGTAGRSRPMTTQTPMFIGSQSKSFTALAVVQLAAQGKIDLDAPVQTYIPWFQVDDPSASALITANHLLHHTSGLSEAGYAVLLPDDATYEQAVRSLAHARLTAPLGTRFQYFNRGYSTLAYLVEVVSGERYADYLRAHVFVPLGMAHTTADPASVTNVAQGYSRFFGFPVPVRQGVRDYEIGAGYIVSTAEDLARYAIAMKNGGAGVLSPEFAQKLFAAGQGGYGMGWFVADGGAKIYHGGANEAFRTDVNLYGRSDRAFVLLTNEGHQADHFISASQLADSVEAVVLGKAPPPVSQGWSVRWVGWAVGAFVLLLVILAVRNFAALPGWRKRAQHMTPARRAWDVAISFIIPTAILLVVFSQLKAFYGYRFNLLTNLVNFRLVMPDVFVLTLVGTLPDYIQGIIKLFWVLTGQASKPASLKDPA